MIRPGHVQPSPPWPKAKFIPAPPNGWGNCETEGFAEGEPHKPRPKIPSPLNHSIRKWEHLCAFCKIFFHLWLAIGGSLFIFNFVFISAGEFHLIPTLLIAATASFIAFWIFAARHLSKLKRQKTDTSDDSQIP